MTRFTSTADSGVDGPAVRHRRQKRSSAALRREKRGRKVHGSVHVSRTFSSEKEGGCSPMRLTASTSTVGQLVTSIASSRARSRPTCRCRRR